MLVGQGKTAFRVNAHRFACILVTILLFSPHSTREKNVPYMVILVSSVDVLKENLRYKINMDILFIVTTYVFYNRLSVFVIPYENEP